MSTNKREYDECMALFLKMINENTEELKKNRMIMEEIFKEMKNMNVDSLELKKLRKELHNLNLRIGGNKF